MWWRRLDAWETSYPNDVLRPLLSWDTDAELNATDLLADLFGVNRGDIRLFYSGTAAIEAALSCVTDPGDEVVIPDYICPTVVEAILEAECRPVVTEVEWPELTLDVNAVNTAVTSETAAIVAPHVSGVPAPIDELSQQHPETLIIEDIAQALGSSFPDGTACGTKGDFAVSSFSNKHIGIGKGGAFINHTREDFSIELTGPTFTDSLRALHVNSDSLLASLLATITYPLRGTHGFRKKCPPFNVQLLKEQLQVLPRLNRARVRNAKRYADRLEGVFEGTECEVVTPRPESFVPLHYLISVPEPVRDEVINHLAEHRIHATPGWKTVSSLYPSKIETTALESPNTERASNTAIGLPLSPKASTEDIRFVVDKLVERLDI